MATKGGSVVFEFKVDDKDVEKKIDSIEKKIKTSSKANAIANGSLNTVINQQKKSLEELKFKYIDVANSQGENSKDALDLKSKYTSLSSELEKNKSIVNKFEKELEGLNETSKKLPVNLSKIGNSIKSGLVKGLKLGLTSTIAISSALAGLIGYGAKFNAEIEQYQTSFEVMTGSAETATKLVSDLKKMGAETPFELSDLAETTQLLMNYGFEAEVAKQRLKMLGDISQGSADKMNRIATAYGQMSSAGKVQLEDIKQMIEAGFNPLQEISQSTGESMASLYDRISKGTISVDEITASMQRSTSVGGKYFQSMEKQSQTVNGQISTLQDNFKNLAGTLASGFSNSLATEILPSLNKSLVGLNEAFEKGGISGFADKLGEELANGITVISNSAPKLIDMGTKITTSLLDGLMQNMPSISQGLSDIAVSLISGLSTILPSIVQALMTGLLGVGQALIQQLPTLIPQIVQGIIGLLDVLLDNAPKFLEAGTQLLLGLAQGLIDAVPLLIDSLPQILQSLATYIISYGPQMLSMGIQLIGKLAVGLIKAIPQLIAKIPEIYMAIRQGFKDGFNNIAQIGMDLVKGLWNGILDLKDWIINKVKGFGKSILNGLMDFFGIHSPSTEFAWIGKMNVLGLDEGMEDMKGKLNDTINSMVNLSPSLLASASNTYNPNINLSINNEFEQDPLGQMVQKRKTFASGSKNDYNFGQGGAL